MARNVFDTRELVVCIAAHLDKKALLSCVQVSKAWTNHFIPILWGSLKINGLECYMRGKHYRWMCFIDQNKRFTQLNESASESFAKYGHYIRELVVENPGALLVLVKHCSSLTKLVCRFSKFHIRFVADHRHEILTLIWELIVKSPQLHTLRLGSVKDKYLLDFPWPHFPDNQLATQQHLQCLQNLSSLRRLDMSMADADYFEFCERFPRVVEARFRLASEQSIFYPYPSQIATDASGRGNNVGHDQHVTPNVVRVQRSLKQLVLEFAFDRLDPQVVQCVLRRFPRLERLTVISPYFKSIDIGLSADPCTWLSYGDLTPERYTEVYGGPLLVVEGSSWADSEVAEIVKVLPVPLKQMRWARMGHQTIEAMVKTQQ